MAEVAARLTGDPALDASGIAVTVTGGQVTLTGTATDSQAQRRAAELVEGVRGVSNVQNNISVAGAGFGADEPWRKPGGSSGHAVPTGSVAGTDRAVASTEAPNSASHVDPGGAVGRRARRPAGSTPPRGPRRVVGLAQEVGRGPAAEGRDRTGRDQGQPGEQAHRPGCILVGAERPGHDRQPEHVERQRPRRCV